jgi:DNA-binding response OmpR family regulator
LPGKFFPTVALREVRPMLRVLVVDDYPDTAESTAYLLQLWGHEVFTARDGTAGVKAADHFRPDVVLLDVALGGRPNGYAVARQIRQQAEKQPVIICVSGHGRAEDRRKSRAAGCDHHLIKPADPDELQRLLQAVSDRFSPAA